LKLCLALQIKRKQKDLRQKNNAFKELSNVANEKDYKANVKMQRELWQRNHVFLNFFIVANEKNTKRIGAKKYRM